MYQKIGFHIEQGDRLVTLEMHKAEATFVLEAAPSQCCLILSLYNNSLEEAPVTFLCGLQPFM